MRSENTFTTDTGKFLSNIHDETPECAQYGCVIHNPTDPRGWDTDWDPTTNWVVRVHPETGHIYPDLDVLNYERRQAAREFQRLSARLARLDSQVIKIQRNERAERDLFA